MYSGINEIDLNGLPWLMIYALTNERTSGGSGVGVDWQGEGNHITYWIYTGLYKIKYSVILFQFIIE